MTFFKLFFNRWHFIRCIKSGRKRGSRADATRFPGLQKSLIISYHEVMEGG